MDHLQVDKAVVVGHSMGCLVAAELAGREAGRVVASVWVGPVLPGVRMGEVFGFVWSLFLFCLVPFVFGYTSPCFR